MLLAAVVFVEAKRLFIKFKVDYNTQSQIYIRIYSTQNDFTGEISNEETSKYYYCERFGNAANLCDICLLHSRE